ncbi:MAG: GTPase [Candidatus Scalinduaceae bacterium]
MMNKETIASITTPIGEGGIGVIQVSGPRSLEIVNAVFRGKKNKDLRSAESKRLYYGDIQLNGTAIDEVIVNVLRKEDSFTGEDLVEVNCHGGMRAVKKTLECIVSAGAKEIHWKELANRSFINDKIDLIQKEALLEIPQARTKLGVKVLLDQYNGALSSFINNLINEIEHGNNINQNLSYVHDKLREILETAVFGCAITSPQKLIITGKPNVGKSTLINALLREDRSIVHSEPGTTRDAVDSMFSIDGIPLTIVDTAGIRETNHIVEKLGVSESKRQLKQADKIIFMLDNSRPFEREDRELMKFIMKRFQVHKTDNNLNKVTVITVVNKTDLPGKLDLTAFGREQLNSICRICASKGDGISELEENLIAEFKTYTEYVPKRPIIFTKRQQDCLSKALSISEQYIHLIKEGKDLDNCSEILSDIRQNLIKCVGISHAK